jgi:hypothetical protein
LLLTRLLLSFGSLGKRIRIFLYNLSSRSPFTICFIYFVSLSFFYFVPSSVSVTLVTLCLGLFSSVFTLVLICCSDMNVPLPFCFFSSYSGSLPSYCTEHLGHGLLILPESWLLYMSLIRNVFEPNSIEIFRSHK